MKREDGVSLGTRQLPHRTAMRGHDAWTQDITDGTPSRNPREHPSRKPRARPGPRAVVHLIHPTPSLPPGAPAKALGGPKNHPDIGGQPHGPARPDRRARTVG